MKVFVTCKEVNSDVSIFATEDMGVVLTILKEPEGPVYKKGHLYELMLTE